MNTLISECPRRPCAASFLRGSFFLIGLFSSSGLHAQLTTVSQTYGIPHFVDGSVFSAFFDFSSQAASPAAAVKHSTLSLDFGKFADLTDDPPFYSDIGIVLRKLDTSFAVLDEVTLIEVGSFNDGSSSTWFDGTITFDDLGAEMVNHDPDQLTTGTFRPIESLSFLDGVYSPFWELRVIDASLQNPLFFHSATLTVMIASSPVPEPAAVGLFGASALGWIVLQRRRSRS